MMIPAGNEAVEDFAEYKYLRDIKGTMLSLVRMSGFHEETFLMVGRSTGATERAHMHSEASFS